MAVFTKYEVFVENLAEGVHNLGADTLDYALTNRAPVVGSDTLLSDITELSTGNGYTQGGHTPSITSSAQTSGTYKLVLADVTITATGAVGPFRYVVLYNNTPSSPLNPVISFWDFGASLTMANLETFTIDADATTGVLTIA